jgi:predicted transcriptional regulator
VRARLEEGRRAVQEGRVVPHDEVKRRLATWRKSGQ